MNGEKAQKHSATSTHTHTLSVCLSVCLSLSLTNISNIPSFFTYALVSIYTQSLLLPPSPSPFLYFLNDISSYSFLASPPPPPPTFFNYATPTKILFISLSIHVPWCAGSGRSPQAEVVVDHSLHPHLPLPLLLGLDPYMVERM